MVQFPHVKITNPSMVGRKTKVEFDGIDVSQWLHRVEFVSDVKDANLIRLDMFVGSVEIEADALGELELGEATQALLIKHGWTPPED